MAGAGQTDAEAASRFRAALDCIDRGHREMAEALRTLRELQPAVTDARSRGKINQGIWRCERALGMRESFFSQSGQDAYLDSHVFKGKRGGVFVEIGGYDGVTGSNCLFFEIRRGWTGLLIEPAPTYFRKAAAFRQATCLQLAVAATAGEAEFMEIRDGYVQMSGLIDSYDAGIRKTVENNPRHRGEVINVETRPLADVLDAHGLVEIDYVSLDVEGGEMAVLSAFPFDRFKIYAWTIENNTASMDVPELMRAQGYNRIEALGQDDLYVRAEA